MPDAADATPQIEVPKGLLHNLRTPLNQIIGYSELLEEQAQVAGQNALVPDLQKVRVAGHQLLALINQNFQPTNAVSPNAIATQETISVEPTLAEPGSATAQGTLLVVDDNETNRDVLSRGLERQGYAVATAENGRRAMEMLLENTVDLVLLDIMMPEMDGYEVLQRLKADYRLQHIPVVMISALTELESVARCIEMGAEDYLPKPFNQTLLRARIGASLEKKRAHDREIQLYEQLEQNFKRLQELEKQRDDLNHMIVHDLRTPLTSVIAGMQTLEALGELNEGQNEAKGIAVMGAETLLGMVNDLLDVEKLESGSMQIEYTELSAAGLLASAVSQVASLAESKPIKLVQNFAAGLPALQGDESKLRRTIVNLLGNAIKFTPPGGTVTVGARYQPPGPSSLKSSILFSVSDTGEGIPAEAFERIFEKFGQVETRKAGRKMSTGLGLTFCKLAIEAHGGQIEVASVLEKGSTFSFTIPLSIAVS